MLYKEEQLQSSEREKVAVQQQLMRKEAELMRAKETIRREQQMRQRVSLVCMCVCMGGYRKFRLGGLNVY